MSTPSTVHEWIDRWQDQRLLDADTATRLHDDAREVSPEGPPLVERALHAARGGIVETLGYLGAAISVGAAVVAADVASWSEPAIIGLLAAITMLGTTALVVLTPPRSDRGSRLAAVSGVAAVAALAGAIAMLLPTPSESPLLVGLPATVLAGVLYARHRQLLLHLALGMTTAGTIVAFGETLGGGSWRTSQVVTGILLVVVASLWIAASETGVLDQPWLGTLAAAGMSHVGIGMMSVLATLDGQGVGDPVLLSLALSVAHTAIGAITDRLRLIVVGSVGLVFTVPLTFTDVLGWSATATAFTLLPVGLALTAWALYANRDEVASSS